MVIKESSKSYLRVEKDITQIVIDSPPLPLRRVISLFFKKKKKTSSFCVIYKRIIRHGC